MVERFIHGGIIICGSQKSPTTSSDNRFSYHFESISSITEFLEEPVKCDIEINTEPEISAIILDNICSEFIQGQPNINNMYPPGYFEPKFPDAMKLYEFVEGSQSLDKNSFLKSFIKENKIKNSRLVTTISSNSILRSRNSNLGKMTVMRKNFSQISVDFMNICNGIKRLLHPKEIRLNRVDNDFNEPKIILLPLTNINGERSYAIGVTFQVPFILTPIERDKKEAIIRLVPYSLMLISKYACRYLISSMLQFIFRDKFHNDMLVLSQGELKKRFYYLTALLTRLPVKSFESEEITQVPDIHWTLVTHEDGKISFSLPHGRPSKWNSESFDLTILSKLLPGKMFNRVILFILLEKRIIFQSLDQPVITIVMESLLALIYPFIKWNFTYFPCLPLNLIDLFQAPGPYLIGYDASKNTKNLDELNFDYCTLIVNLDHSSCVIKERREIPSLSNIEYSLRGVFAKYFEQTFNDNIVRRFKLSRNLSRLRPTEAQLRAEHYRQNREMRKCFQEFLSDILSPIREYKDTIRQANISCRQFVQQYLTMNYSERIDFYREFLQTILFYNYYSSDMVVVFDNDNSDMSKEIIELLFQNKLESSYGFYTAEDNFLKKLLTTLHGSGILVRNFILAHYMQMTYDPEEPRNTQAIMKIYRRLKSQMLASQDETKISKIIKEINRKSDGDLIDKFDDFEIKCSMGDVDLTKPKEFVHIFMSYCIIGDYNLLVSLYETFKRGLVPISNEIIVSFTEKFIDHAMQVRDLNVSLLLDKFLVNSHQYGNEILLILTNEPIQIDNVVMMHVGLTQYRMIFFLVRQNNINTAIAYTEIIQLDMEPDERELIISTRNVVYKEFVLKFPTDDEYRSFYNAIMTLRRTCNRISRMKDQSMNWNYLLECFLISQTLNSSGYDTNEFFTSLQESTEDRPLIRQINPVNLIKKSFMSTFNLVIHQDDKDNNIQFFDFYIGNEIQIVNCIGQTNEDGEKLWIFLNAKVFNKFLGDRQDMAWVICVDLEDFDYTGCLVKTLPTSIVTASIIHDDHNRTMRIWISGIDGIIYIFDMNVVLCDTLDIEDARDSSPFYNERILYILPVFDEIIAISSKNHVYQYDPDGYQLRFMLDMKIPEQCRRADVVQGNLVVMGDTLIKVITSLEDENQSFLNLYEFSRNISLTFTQIMAYSSTDTSFYIAVSYESEMFVDVLHIIVNKNKNSIGYERIQRFNLDMLNSEEDKNYITCLTDGFIGINNGSLIKLPQDVFCEDNIDISTTLRVHCDYVKIIGRLSSFIYTCGGGSNDQVIKIWKI